MAVSLLLGLGGLAQPGGVLAQERGAVLITVNDYLGLDQREETIDVYFGGVLGGKLHIDAGHPNDSFVALVADVDELSFSLCGVLLKTAADGSVATHVIDSGGVMTGYRNAEFDTVTLDDRLFTLRDVAAVASTTMGRGPACAALIS